MGRMGRKGRKGRQGSEEPSPRAQRGGLDQVQRLRFAQADLASHPPFPPLPPFPPYSYRSDSTGSTAVAAGNGLFPTEPVGYHQGCCAYATLVLPNSGVKVSEHFTGGHDGPSPNAHCARDRPARRMQPRSRHGPAPGLPEGPGWCVPVGHLARCNWSGIGRQQERNGGGVRAGLPAGSVEEWGPLRAAHDTCGSLGGNRHQLGW
jgi:hypothetical protein